MESDTPRRPSDQASATEVALAEDTQSILVALNASAAPPDVQRPGKKPATKYENKIEVNLLIDC